MLDHAKGLLPAVSIPIPDSIPSWTMPVAKFVALVIGLRLTVEETRPSPFGQDWVAGHVGCSPAGASCALRTLKNVGFLTDEEPMPARHSKSQGTAVYGIAGYTSDGVQVVDVDRAENGVPDAEVEPAAVPVEAEHVGAGRDPVEPSAELPDKAAVGDAEVGASARPGVVASGDAAEDVIACHERERHARPPTPEFLLERAVALDNKATRHKAYWLAAQLRDNGYDEHGEAFETLLDFAARQPASFNTAHALRALRAAYSRPAGNPWGVR